jgi:hypothetical protein
MHIVFLLLFDCCIIHVHIFILWRLYKRQRQNQERIFCVNISYVNAITRHWMMLGSTEVWIPLTFRCYLSFDEIYGTGNFQFLPIIRRTTFFRNCLKCPHNEILEVGKSFAKSKLCAENDDKKIYNFLFAIYVIGKP